MGSRRRAPEAIARKQPHAPPGAAAGSWPLPTFASRKAGSQVAMLLCTLCTISSSARHTDKQAHA